MQEQTAMLAVDLGGTRLRTAVFDAAGTRRSHVAEATPHDDPAALVRAMRLLAAEAGIEPQHAVVGVPGIVDLATGSAPHLPQLPGWHGAMTATAIGEGGSGEAQGQAASKGDGAELQGHGVRSNQGRRAPGNGWAEP